MVRWGTQKLVYFAQTAALILNFTLHSAYTLQFPRDLHPIQIRKVEQDVKWTPWNSPHLVVRPGNSLKQHSISKKRDSKVRLTLNNRDQGDAMGVSTRDKTKLKHIIVSIMKYLKNSMPIVSNQWWSFKNRIRKKFGKYTIYVLECENEKYYVGSTTNRKQRFKEHQRERGGSKWTRRYRPIRVLEEYRRVPEAYHLGMESKITAEYMLEYGVNNVRGAMFSQPRNFTMSDLSSLTGFIGHYNNLSYNSVRRKLVHVLPK